MVGPKGVACWTPTSKQNQNFTTAVCERLFSSSGTAKHTTEHEFVETSRRSDSPRWHISRCLAAAFADRRAATSTIPTPIAGSHYYGTANDSHWGISSYFFQQHGGENLRHSLEVVV